MKTVLFCFLYFLGIITTVLLGIWLVSLVLFVFGAADYPGEIAFISKWIFLFCPFVLLGRTKKIWMAREKIFDRLEEFFLKFD